MKNEIEILPGVKAEPLFTDEEYQAFREWWREEVAPEMERLERLHAPDPIVG